MRKLRSVITSLISAVAVVFVPFKAAAELSEAEAREHLKQGALVVDVRSAEEFKARHLTNVINIPLPELKDKISSVTTNKSQVLLLHCQSGRRSGIAERELRELGYTNAFNLGSFERAGKILESRNK
jgi:phage shock protein E